MNKEEIETKLVSLAYDKAEPFCYGCYVQVKKAKGSSPRCPKCLSDDLMLVLPGIDGPEYGTDWVVRALLRDNLTAVDTEEAFEDSVAQCYPETTTVAWLELDTVSVVKEMDPISWRIAQGEWESSEEEDGNILSFDGGTNYYWAHDVENFLDENESTENCA